MTIIWDKIKKNIVETLSDAIDKTEELTSVGRIKLEILQLEHRIDEQFTELGKLVYLRFSQNPDIQTPAGKVADIKKEIDDLEVQLREKEKELVRIREEDGIDFDS